MKTVKSKDGTTIAYDQTGQGQAVILVDGALQYRAFDQGMTELANLLSPYFTVIHYDRHGRGDSTDTPPYAVEREIEDIEALVNAAGGTASLYGISSGAALAMEAAVALDGRIRKLAMYEPPYNNDESARQAWKEYTRQYGPRRRVPQPRRPRRQPEGDCATSSTRSSSSTSTGSPASRSASSR